MSILVIFPVGQEASADTYLTFCNINNPDLVYDSGAIWYYSDRVDKYGQRCVAYLGPGGRLDITTEPEGGPAARANGVLSATVEWPEEEEG